MENVHDFVLLMQVNYAVNGNQMMLIGIHVYLMFFVVVEQ
jgi:hypothetical protein